MTRLLLVLSFGLTLYAQSFQAGYARRDITPREAVRMWGYGSRHAALSPGTMASLDEAMIRPSCRTATLPLYGLVVILCSG